MFRLPRPCEMNKGIWLFILSKLREAKKHNAKQAMWEKPKDAIKGPFNELCHLIKLNPQKFL